MMVSGVNISPEEGAVGTRGVTMAEVAVRAGVSKMAVSSVLNPSPRSRTRVSEATRARILEAAASMRYTPNAVARSLRRQKTDIIAFHNAQSVVFNPDYPFYARILAGIQDGCTQHKKDLLTYANFAGRSDDDIVMGLHNGQIDGLVLYVRAVTPLVQRLIESHLSIVTLGEPVEGAPYVGIDEESAGQLLAQHVADKGYKRVLYRSYQEQIPSPTLMNRQRAFCQSAQKLGLSVSLSAYDPKSNWPTPEEEILFLSQGRPEVVVCCSDASADAVAEFCIRNGIRVPQDMAIGGVDGLISSRRPSLRLTTIQAPWRQVARTAVGLLAACCNGEDVPSRTILPVELSEGETM